MFHERGFSATQRCNIFDKIFVQVISMLLHLLRLKILLHFAPVLLHFEFKSCYNSLSFATLHLGIYKATSEQDKPQGPEEFRVNK